MRTRARPLNGTMEGGGPTGAELSRSLGRQRPADVVATSRAGDPTVPSKRSMGSARQRRTQGTAPQGRRSIPRDIGRSGGPGRGCWGGWWVGWGVGGRKRHRPRKHTAPSSTPPGGIGGSSGRVVWTRSTHTWRPGPRQGVSAAHTHVPSSNSTAKSKAGRPAHPPQRHRQAPATTAVCHPLCSKGGRDRRP